MGRDMRNVKILRINRFEVKVAVKYVVCVPVFYVDDGSVRLSSAVRC